MYIPKPFEQQDLEKSIAFMNVYNFAIIVSTQNEIPIATHLPFIVEEKNSEILLLSHISKANPQWNTFIDKEVLVIFSEPHAYISPSLYEHTQNVPTWNYLAVHTYGKIKLAETEEKKMEILLKQMHSFEESYLKQFNSLDKKYVADLMSGIVAFEITVTDLQSKAKLSQNKSHKDRQTIKEHLINSNDSAKSDVGKYM